MRKTFTTTIEETIQKQFKLACVKDEVNMNDVLEKMMILYSEGKIKVERDEAK